MSGEWHRPTGDGTGWGEERDGADGYDMIGDDTPLEQLRAEWTDTDTDTPPPTTERRFGERLRQVVPIPEYAGLTFQERGGHTYAYHEGRFVFRVTAGEKESITCLLRMAYNSGRASLGPIADAIDLDAAHQLEWQAATEENRISSALTLARQQIEQLVEELRYSALVLLDEFDEEPRDVVSAEQLLERLGSIFSGGSVGAADTQSSA